MTAFQTSAPNRTLWVSDLQISAPNFQISAPNFSDLRKYLASTPEEYAKRNYANNKAKYGTVIASLTAQQRYAIVWDITAAGLGLNKFCYAGLIAAHKSKEPVTDDLAS
ncbi:hypothetical protein T459_20054 [Capsicum annuum]|uniref:Uncharacterized protein n=1 Tax=Capsicum annuum TaxID=4072 RepID=A0A2G2Z3E1_CAPAN|nr:hypothetical protein T459_20054 [Capsicum annuum]